MSMCAKVSQRKKNKNKIPLILNVFYQQNFVFKFSFALHFKFVNKQLYNISSQKKYNQTAENIFKTEHFI